MAYEARVGDVAIQKSARHANAVYARFCFGTEVAVFAKGAVGRLGIGAKTCGGVALTGEMALV